MWPGVLFVAFDKHMKVIYVSKNTLPNLPVSFEKGGGGGGVLSLF